MNLLDFFGGGIIESVGKITDGLITSDEERAEKENEKQKTSLHHKVEMAKLSIEDKKLDYGLMQNEMDNITSRWTSDNTSVWLAKNVRPMTLIFLLFVLTFMAFTSGNVGEFKIANNFVDLFQILAITAFGAYFGGRSMEKIKKSA
jgi:hypothetical protein